MTPLPPEVLVELERLLKDATPGVLYVVQNMAGPVLVYAGEDLFCSMRISRREQEYAALIAAAVNALPALIDTARSTEAMRAENERLTEEAKLWRMGDVVLKCEFVLMRARAETAELSLKAAREALEQIRTMEQSTPAIRRIAQAVLSTVTPTGDEDAG